jgi:hypothetical protein
MPKEIIMYFSLDNVSLKLDPMILKWEKFMVLNSI